MTFYDVLGVPPTASHDDITKAYRRLSKALHPDKVRQQLMAERAQARNKKAGAKPGVHVTKPPSQAELRAAIKEASERQTRLSLVAKILKGPGRDRYDHFLKNGFPVWKGTEYYYNRYRPGIVTVLAGLFLVGGGVIHYLALYMSWRRQREFVDRYIRFARDTAWGGNVGIPGIDGEHAAVPAIEPTDENDRQGPPLPSNRKQRRMQERDAKKDTAKESGKKTKKKTATSEKQQAAPLGPAGAKKRVIAENGKVLVVDSLGDVYLEEEDEDGNVEELLLDVSQPRFPPLFSCSFLFISLLTCLPMQPNELPCPSIRDTLVVRVPIWLYRKATTPFIKRTSQKAVVAEGDGLTVKRTVIEEDDSDAVQHTPSSDSVDDFELLDKSIESVARPKTTGSQVSTSGKTGKRKGKKR